MYLFIYLRSLEARRLPLCFVSLLLICHIVRLASLHLWQRCIQGTKWLLQLLDAFIGFALAFNQLQKLFIAS